MYTPSIFSNNFFDDFMNFSFPDVEKTLYGKHAAHMMSTDLKETENGYEMSIDLPGFKKDEVTAHLKDEKAEDGKYLHRERYAGSMSRSYYVGKGVTEEDIHAKYENGILTLQIPKDEKKPVEEKKYISIEG